MWEAGDDLEAGMTRERIHKLVDPPFDSKSVDPYDIVMYVTIVASFLPLATHARHVAFDVIEAIATAFFAVDYILRWVTADYIPRLEKMGRRAFLLYPVTPMAIVDLLTIIPGLALFGVGFKAFGTLRLLLLLKLLRLARVLRYSRSARLMWRVVQRQRRPLIVVCGISATYVVIMALIMFNIEPQSFDGFLSAIYWAAMSLTTVGYGDIYPVTTLGRMATVLSSIVGIAVIALPAAIITAGLMEELSKRTERDERNRVRSSSRTRHH